MNNIHQQSGFTLIEVIISLAVLSALMLGMMNLTNNTQDIYERVISEDREMLKIETAMSRLEWDFSQIYSPLYFSHIMNPEGMSDLEGQVYNQLLDAYQSNARYNLLSYDGIPVPLFKNPEKSEFIFFTSSNRRKMQNAKQSNFAWVRYALENDNLKDEYGPKSVNAQYMLTRQLLTHDIYSKDEIDWNDVKAQILMRGISKLSFEFYNPENEKWTENLDIIKNGRNLIHAIRVTIKYFESEDNEVTSVRIFRPLFPEFTPEDMYKFLNANPKKGDGTGTDGGNN